MSTPKERFHEITHRWFLSENVLFEVYCKHNLKENNSMPIPLRSGKGVIEYNPAQIDLLSDPALEQLLRVEIIRLCLRHPYERQPTGCCPQALHMGSDMVIEPVYKVPLAELAKPGDMGLPVGQHFEWYADHVNEKLREKVKQKQQSQPGTNRTDGTPTSGDSKEQEEGTPQENNEGGSLGGDGQTGKGKKGKKEGTKGSGEQQSGADGEDGTSGGVEEGIGTEMSLSDPYTELWQEDEEMLETLKEVLEKVTNWGTIPGEVVAVIQKALQARIDYRKVLRAFQTSIISTNRNLTRMRPNRRFGFEAMGSKHDMSSRLLVAVDVSGSVSDKALSKFFRVITNFFKNGVEHIDVIQFDRRVSDKVLQLKKGCKELRSQSVSIKGRGGTNFQCVIDYLQEHNFYDGLIFFTDGFAPTPIIRFPTRTKLLWVTETEEEYNLHKDWMNRLGRSCFIM